MQILITDAQENVQIYEILSWTHFYLLQSTADVYIWILDSDLVNLYCMYGRA